MSRRKLAYLGTAAAAAVAVVLSTSPAFASSGDVLSYGAVNPGGTNVATTDALTGSLAAGTTNTFKFTSNGTSVTITCTAATLNAKASTNPAAPGTATVSISTLTFNDGATQCTLTGLSGVTVVSAVLKSGTTATASVTDGTTDNFTITSLNEAVTLHTGVGNIICDYGTNSSVTSILGVVTNPNSSGTGGTIAFSSDPVALISGSSFCGASGSTGTFTATFGGITDTSGTGTNTAVYVN
ncbi:MAG TPA: hypothetical protein VH372_02800 [Actinospica sp.]|jgi:hypothetical protein|nr:hypothetical protein [Actinospica sp.]